MYVMCAALMDCAGAERSDLGKARHFFINLLGPVMFFLAGSDYIARP